MNEMNKFIFNKREKIKKKMKKEEKEKKENV